MANSKIFIGWWECATCGQEFTGAMHLGLAKAWWSSAQRLPEENLDRLSAANNLAGALHGQGNYVSAETMYRELLAVQQRVLGSEHPNTLNSANNLATALKYQGKYGEVETMYRETLAVQQRVLGSEHPHTLNTANNLAACVRASRGISDSAK